MRRVLQRCVLVRVVVTTVAVAAPAAAASALAAASQAPTMVGPVRASEHTSTSVRLRWAPARDDVGVAGYRIYRGRAGTLQTRLAHIATIDPASNYTASHL